MKRFVLIGLALLFMSAAMAQVEDHRKESTNTSQSDAKKLFEDFKEQAKEEYASFRQKANEEYAQFMEEVWQTFNVMEAEEIPWEPKPVTPLEDVAPVTNSKIEYDMAEETGVLPSAELSKEGMIEKWGTARASRPEPMEPIAPVFESDEAVQSLVLYGSSFPVRMEKMEKEKRIKLRNVSEKSVARMWKKLSCKYYDNIVAECLQQRKERNLCDWAYVKLTEKMANKYFEPGSNESVVLRMYLLTQSGYQMRIARADDKLTRLIGSEEKIYRYKYFIMDGIQFYILDRTMQNKSMDVFNRAFPGEKSMSLAVTQPDFTLVRTARRNLTAKNYPELSVAVETNRNLLDFYDDYPLTSQWDYYSKASLSKQVKEILYPAIRKAIDGKSELEAVNIILDFVQTGLQYATDQEQFGYERPLYPDESIYYPFCDCEDRAILFSCLIRELVGLDVVLLNYPSHLSTAVRFNEDVEGDYLSIDDQKYVICEPTFTKGAPVGRCASKLKSVKPKVVKI